MNTFPTVQLPGVTDEDRAPLAALHADAEARAAQRFGMLVALMAKARAGATLYNGTVPGRVKAARRKRGKAQRAARKVHR